MQAKVTSAHDVGDDVLEVRGVLVGEVVMGDDGEEVTEPEHVVRGWVSALNNHYDEDDYEPADPDDFGEGQRHLAAGATPRVMTDAERLAYCERLLIQDVPVSEAKPRDLGISST